MELDKLGKMSLRIGWPDGNLTAEQAYGSLKRKKATGRDQPALGRPVSLALIARTLNYGREPGRTLGGVAYGRIPPRPFMELAKKRVGEKAGKILAAYLPEVLSGRMTERWLVERLGAMAAGEVRRAMTEGKWEPLAPSTLASRRHGGNTPLVDTGTLRASVSFEIVDSET